LKSILYSLFIWSVRVIYAEADKRLLVQTVRQRDSEAPVNSPSPAKRERAGVRVT